MTQPIIILALHWLLLGSFVLVLLGPDSEGGAAQGIALEQLSAVMECYL